MKRQPALALAFVLLAGLACELPGTTSPTPFAFPTPNLTLTAIYAPTATSQPEQTTPGPEQTDPVGPTDTPTLPAQPATATATVSGETTRPNGSPIAAPRFDSPPTIDAELDDWPSQRHPLSEPVFGLSNWSGGDDLSGAFAVAWDAANLYLALEVSDDTFVQTASGRTLFRGDSAEILLDEALSADFNATTLSSDDFQIGLSPGNFDGLAPEAYRWFPRGVEGGLSTTVVAAAQTDSGYILEAEVPWLVFGAEPAPGARYGFAISLSDNDQPGTAVQQSLVSSVRTRSLTDPTTWGTLVLNPAD